MEILVRHAYSISFFILLKDKNAANQKHLVLKGRLTQILHLQTPTSVVTNCISYKHWGNEIVIILNSI